jgi:hypothetical protein
MCKVAEECGDDFTLLRELAGAYTPRSMVDSVKIEQLFNDLRKTERLLHTKWSSSAQQLAAVQIRGVQRRFTQEGQGYRV